MSEPLLRIERLTLRFGGVVAVNKLDLELMEGSIHAIIGPNGAGKTTLINGICGLVRAQSGHVWLRDKDLLRLPAAARSRLRIARTFQQPALVNNLTVLENVQLGLYSSARTSFAEDMVFAPRAAGEERRSRELARAAIEQLGLQVDQSAEVKSLPLGVRKMIDLARAFVSDPLVLLMDEPTSGLSGTETKEIEAVIRRLKGDRTLVLIAHHLEFVMGLADVVTVLNFGERIAEGPPGQVRRDPRVIETYIGAAV